MPKLQYPTLITWTDPSGHVHVPPDPPLTEGRPPWSTAPDEYPRSRPLAQCPSLRCRRRKACHDLIYKKYCRKSHLGREAFLEALAAKLERLIPPDPKRKPSDGIEPPPRELKLALQAREDEIEREELLAFQTRWIDGQKQLHANKRGRSLQDSRSLSQAMAARVNSHEKKR